MRKESAALRHGGQSLLILSCVLLVGAVLVSQLDLPVLGKNPTAPMKKSVSIRDSFMAHTTTSTGVTTPVKLCSGVHAFSWRQTMLVPDNWKAATCQNFANSIGLTEYQLGCANPNSFSWGNMHGSTPADNQCGW